MSLLADPVWSQVSAASPAERHAWFGELHVHSSWSIDAYVFGTHIGPEEAIQ